PQYSECGLPPPALFRVTVPSPGPSKNRVWPLITLSQPTRQSSGLAAGDCKTKIHHKRIGQAGPIKRAVNLHGHNGLALTLDYLHDLQCDVDGEDFAIAPFLDRSDAAKLPPHVFHDGIMREA